MTRYDAELLAVANGRAVPTASIPRLSGTAFGEVIIEAVAAGLRVVALFGKAGGGDRAVDLWVVLGDDQSHRLLLGRTAVHAGRFLSLTPTCPEVHLFEREIAEEFGLEPVGHPWPKPVRKRDFSLPAANPNGVGSKERTPAEVAFYRVAGRDVHEVAVGPVHAGVIEPGHFRFQCHGENVFHLEIALGYQHRGVEAALERGPDQRSIHLAETLAGDESVAHATAYCQAIEALTGCPPPERSLWIRAAALELERLANHVGDLGALANDVAYLPTAAFCGRLRGEFLNMTASISGNRFGRGIVRPGGVGFDIDRKRADDLLHRLGVAMKETVEAVDLLWDTQAVLARFEGTGRVTSSAARQLGLVGPAARASGLKRDARADHPIGFWRTTAVPVFVSENGDVLARAECRRFETTRSAEFVRAILADLPAGSVRTPPGSLRPEMTTVALVESWRGEICHVAVTDATGRLARYKVVDPSFHNWSGLAHALREQEISDFPLCNKSFNLSYCGHDL